MIARTPCLLAAVLLSVSACSSATDESDVLDDDVSAVVGADPAKCKVDATLSARARDYLFSSGQAKASQESSYEWASTRWTARKAVVTPDRTACLLVMNLASAASVGDATVVQDGDGGTVVIGYNTATKRFRLFKNTVRVPSTLYVALGGPSKFPEGHPSAPGIPAGEEGRDANADTLMYFVQLTGRSAEHAYAEALTGIRVPGLAAKIDANVGAPTGKAAFDPTRGRTWKLRDATFDLSRGNTAEVLDVYADQLDNDFSGYLRGSGGEVAPWTAYVLRYATDPAGPWTKVSRPKFEGDLPPLIAAEQPAPSGGERVSYQCRADTDRARTLSLELQGAQLISATLVNPPEVDAALVAFDQADFWQTSRFQRATHTIAPGETLSLSYRLRDTSGKRLTLAESLTGTTTQPGGAQGGKVTVTYEDASMPWVETRVKHEYRYECRLAR